jgi:uncharacterized protein
VLIDANILLYATDGSSPYHGTARPWLESQLNGPRRVGLPWLSLWAFVRISTNPRATLRPLTPGQAWSIVEAWLNAPAAWVVEPGPGHREILGRLLVERDIRAGLVTDAVVAALCIEHGLTIVSADSDFARFTDITWLNPVA